MWKSIVAIFCIISNFFTLLFTDIDSIPEIPYNQTINFDAVSADEINITQEEKASARKWYEENILLKGNIKKLPFDFKLGTKSLNNNLDEWDISVSAESEKDAVYPGGKTSYVTLTHKKSDVVATVEATYYEENAACEWTVFIENTGDENSKTVSDFYALDYEFDTGRADVYYSKGSRDEPYDFALLTRNLSSIPAVFDCDDGRSTDTYLPYFNIAGEDCSVILGVGWTGSWKAQLTEAFHNTYMKVKQEKLKGYLLPGEEIRSPLVSLSFYEGESPLKGFNQFRSWVLESVYPQNIPSTLDMLEVAGPLSTLTTDEIIATMDNFPEKVFEQIDCFWMDAGWYEYEEGWHDFIGNWTPDTSRYDNGIIELSQYAESKDCGLVLWYEPERAHPGTIFYEYAKDKDQWLIHEKSEDFAMFNIGNEDALKYYCESIVASMKENGVTLYRQDFNFSPDKFWKVADKEFYDGRKGFCENHYITNLYRYLDYLTAEIDGLIIDNCASGGRRLDLEMTRRSIPVWRSDYNCSPHENILEATQAMTYGLSFWLPLTGTVQYNTDEYAARSSIMPFTLETFGTIYSEHFADYNLQREMMSGNYFPIECGGYSSSKILAMEYISKDAKAGDVLLYKRENVEEKEYTLNLNGLIEDEMYNVYSIDAPDEIYTLSGSELMEKGINISFPEGKKAYVFMFEATA